jgi:transmembrane sensor
MMIDLLLHLRGRKLPSDPREAADWWLARRALHGLSPRDEAGFARWLADPVNAASFARADAAHFRAGLCAAEPEILQLRAEALRPRPFARVVGPRLVAGLAAAAVVCAVMAGVTLQPRPQIAPQPAPERPAIAASDSKRYETRLGEQRRVRLDDGSMVSLNTGSVLQVSYNKQRRDVRLLKGQALFEVAHNSAWPFVVTAGDRQVTAIGTAFDVRLDGSVVSVVLVEGKVRVEPLHLKGLERLVPHLAEEVLAPGERLVARQGVAEVRIAAADVQEATRWTEGQIIFRDDLMSAAVGELNRYSETRLFVTDPRVAGLKVSGVFSVTHPEYFIDAVTAFYPVDVRRRSPGVVELVWREPL